MRTASGVSSSTQTYYAYGTVRTTSGTLPTDYTFTGQKLDASAGLMYYGARYYDAAIGRFAQPDSIVPNPYNPQSLNRYSYTLNNPVRYTDPTGRCIPEECGNAYGNVSNIWTAPLPGQASASDGAGDDLKTNGASMSAVVTQTQPQGACQNAAGCIGAPELPPCKSPSGCIGPRGLKGKRQFPEYVPDVFILTGGYLGGLGNIFGLNSLDIVVQLETSEVYVAHTYAKPYGDDLMSPQVSGSVMAGVMWNVDSPTDYQGTFEVQGASAIAYGVEHLQSPGGRAWGLLGGYSGGVPDIGAYAVHTYSDVFWIIRP